MMGAHATTKGGRGLEKSKVREIAAATVRLAKGGEPPGRARIRVLYPEAHHDTFAEGYRIGCLDLVLTPGGKPLTGETAEERDLIKDRVARLGAWRLTHPAYFGPTHTARRAGLRGRGGPTA